MFILLQYEPGYNAGVRTRILLAGALGCLLVSGLGLMARPWIQAGAMYPWKSAALFAVMMAMASAFTGDHPFPRFGAANRVTLVRAVLLALVAALIGESESARVASTAVILAIIIAALDGVDGWLARRSRMASAFGARVDMGTDALLIMVLSVLVWQHGKAGAWVLLAGMMRYAFVAAGWVLPWMAGPLQPTLRGKTIAVCQMVGLSVALAPIVPAKFSAIAAAVVLLALVWSFSIDVMRLWRSRQAHAG